jgi:hypothetical protein
VLRTGALDAARTETKRDTHAEYLRFQYETTVRTFAVLRADSPGKAA